MYIYCVSELLAPSVHAELSALCVTRLRLISNLKNFLLQDSWARLLTNLPGHKTLSYTFMNG